eukprot:2683351-Amphidinium_carterae.1
MLHGVAVGTTREEVAEALKELQWPAIVHSRVGRQEIRADRCLASYGADATTVDTFPVGRTRGAYQG